MHVLPKRAAAVAVAVAAVGSKSQARTCFFGEVSLSFWAL